MCMNDDTISIFVLCSRSVWCFSFTYQYFGCIYDGIVWGTKAAAPLKFGTSLSGRKGFSGLIVGDTSTLVVKLLRRHQQYLSGKGEGVMHLRVLIVAYYLWNEFTILTVSQWSERACDGLEVHDSSALRIVKRSNSR